MPGRTAPVIDGSLTDINAVLRRQVLVDDINNAFRQVAVSGPLAGILGYSEESLASSDIIDDPRSGIVHALSLRIVPERMAKIQVRYDNEFGHSKRLFEVASKLP